MVATRDYAAIARWVRSHIRESGVSMLAGMRLVRALPAAVAAVVILAGCAPIAAAPSPTETAAPPPSPTTEPAGLFACEDLAGTELIAAALAGRDGESPDPVAARQPSADLSDLAVDIAGGLTCGWRIGEPEGNPLEYR